MPQKEVDPPWRKWRGVEIARGMWGGWIWRVAFVTPILRGWKEEGVNPLLNMGEGEEEGNDFSPGGRSSGFAKCLLFRCNQKEIAFSYSLLASGNILSFTDRLE